MAIEFPSSGLTPDVTTYSYGTATWIWNGSAWKLVSQPGYTGSAGSTGFTGSSGSLGYTGSAGAGYTGSASTVVGYTGSRGGYVEWQSGQTSNFAAVAGKGYFTDTTSSAITATLPASATLGDEITFVDVAGTFDTNNLTVARNGHKIQGDASDLTVSVERAAFTLVYYNVNQGWIFREK
jgi:hypothetical protein